MRPPSSAPRGLNPTVLLVNTAARTGEHSFELARQSLKSLGVDLADAHAVKQPERMDQLLSQALADGARRIIVGGGDGTISAAANRLVGTDAVLGVLPLGTCNDFIRSLRIQSDLQQACEVAATGRVKEVDVGRCNETYFLNAASVGLSSAVTRNIKGEVKRRLGRAAFALSAATEVWKQAPFRVRLRTAQRVEELETMQVVVGNGRYHGGGQLVAPDATLSDRCLDVYAIAAGHTAARGPHPEPSQLRDVWTLFRVAMLIRRGRHISHEHVIHLRTSELHLEADPRQEVDVDGELITHTPARFHLVPRALKVLVPAME